MKQPFVRKLLLSAIFALNSICFITLADELIELGQPIGALYEAVCQLAEKCLDHQVCITIDNPELFIPIFQEIMADESLSAERRFAAQRCHDNLADVRQLVVNDLLKIMPVLMEIAQSYEMTKAERPSSTENGAISGCCSPCDNNQILRLLNLIRIELLTCCENIQIDFQETWTILAGLNFAVTATVDLSGVFTALDACCRDIQVDFNGVFTALTDIRNTLTICCQEINQDFNAVFTAIFDVKNTLTICCAAIDVDFNGVFTALANASITINLSPVFTVLADIKGTLTECCAEIQRDFNGVFSVLNNLSFDLTTTIDLSGVFTALDACCREIQIDFNGVFSVLNTLSLTATVDLSGVFTALADIKNTLTICCDRLDSDNCKPIYIKQSDFGVGGLITYVISQPGIYKLAENIQFNAGAEAIRITASGVLLDLQCFSLSGLAGSSLFGIQIIPGAPQSDITITNGLIRDFNVGISVSAAGGGVVTQPVERVSISGVSITACPLRGIEFFASSFAQPNAINQGIIQNCMITRCGSATPLAGQVAGAVSLQGCVDVGLVNCLMNLNGSGASGNNTQVVRIANSLKCSLVGCQMNDNAAFNNLRVVNLSGAVESTLQDCVAKNNSCLGDARGYSLENTATGNEFYNVTMLALTATGIVDAFFTTTNCDRNLFINARAVGTTATGAGLAAIATGFNFINNRFNNCIDCIAEGTTAPNTTFVANFASFGFDMNVTGSNTLLRCSSLDSTANLLNVATRSVGILVRNGTNNDVQDSYATRNTVGIRLDPDGGITTPTNNFVRNRSVGNFVTQYEGFAATSRASAASINNINAITAAWTNIGVGLQTP